RRRLAGCPAGVSPADYSALLVFLSERLNLHIHARRQIQLHQRIDRLLRRLQNIQQPLVGADFELLPRLLVHVRRPQHAVLVLHRGQRNRSRDLRAGALCRLHDLARRLIQNAVVVGFQPDANSFFSSHCFSLFTPPGSPRRKDLAASYKPRIYFHYATISAIVPAPTVWPPSRIANRNPFSIATGVISSITRLTLSPGITISVPAGNSATPVTSVVRK